MRRHLKDRRMWLLRSFALNFDAMSYTIKRFISTINIQIHRELLILWVLSILISIVIIGFSFYLSPDDVDNGVLSFLSLPHEHCILCGMSHSLTLMSRGSFYEAWGWNHGGPFLFILLVTNSLIGIFISVRKVRVLSRS
jgi:hypothetical protein